MNRIILNKLVLSSDNKSPAIVEFKAGFNAITGASDTGKSLIFQCIEYALGGSRTPKSPPEGRDYTDVYLTLSSAEKVYTIHRSLLGGDARVFQKSYDEINSLEDGKVISSDAKSKDSLSQLLLSIICLEGKQLKRNQSGLKAGFTFNVLRKAIAVSEETIIREVSPIFAMNEQNATVAKSAARLMFQGTDYSNMPVYDEPKVHKAKIEAKISVLEDLIGSKEQTNSSGHNDNESIQDQLAKLEQSIENYINILSSKQSELDNLLEKRKEALDDSIAAESKIDHFNEVIGRFALLKKHYQSDLRRLDAVIETGSFLSQMEVDNCPLCGSLPKYHDKECSINSEEIERLQQSGSNEKKKILSLQGDLVDTLEGLENDRNEFVKKQKENKELYKTISSTISALLEPEILSKKTQIRKLFEKKKELEVSLATHDHLTELQELKASLEKQSKTPPKDKDDPGLEASETSKFIEIVKERLLSWGYPDLTSVGFSEKYQDIILGEKNRFEQGKGYRGITYAAFIISLMDLCIEKEQPHPGFVMLDSPTTAYQKADESAEEEGILDMAKQLYLNLSDMPSDSQIIVLDNYADINELPAKALTKMNHIHFTKNHSHGRYGFIPSE